MIKNVILLTKISTRNFLENYDLFKKGEKKINRKSIYLWLMIIVFITIVWISNEVLNQLQDINQLSIFPRFIIALITIIMFMQTILLTMNVLYFSKDIDFFLSLAIKPEELLLSKINTILIMLYSTELIFMFVPLILYGISAVMNISYYIYLLFVILLLPIFPVTVMTLLTLFFMKFIKVIKHKNIFQIMVTIIFVIMVVVAEVVYMKSIFSEQADLGFNLKNIADNINKSVIVAEPLISILNEQNVLINFLKIIGIYSVLCLFLMIIGKKIYLKNVLKTREYNKNKIIKQVNFDLQCKQQNLYKAYLKNEYTNIYRNAIFFMQTIFPICMTIFSIICIALYVKFGLANQVQEISDFMNHLHLNIEGVCIILGGIQILYSMVNISITAISRQGPNVIFMKYIPVSLYKQFLLKNIPQITVNMIVALIVLIVLEILFPMISILDAIIIYMISIIFSILNSYLMLIVDIKRPILDWKAEIEVFKQNGNKIFQYIWTIIVILLLMYIRRVVENLNFYIGIFAIFIIFSILLLIVNIYIKKQIKDNTLFKNII